MGPLTGIRVVELAGLGPVPFCGMLLADLGAQVIRVERVAGGTADPMYGVVGRGRRSLAVDLKHPEGREIVLRLAETADVLVEGFRPGVTERLGLGPEDCHDRNPRLVYGRMTGWGSEGPYATMAGHDIDYIALTGALHAIGPADRPIPPLNLVGDYGGGALYLAVGVLAALVERQGSGRGQVVDAAMVDGAAHLMAPFHHLRSLGAWEDARERNLLDGGAPFYTTYRCADGRFVAVGALEPHFYDRLLAGLGLERTDLPDQMDRDRWPELRRALATAFATRTRDEWEAVFAGTDACVAPVLGLDEAPDHPQMRARGTFVEVDGRPVPAPAPRFARTPAATPTTAPPPGADTDEILAEVGYRPTDVERLRAEGVVR